ncbi:MAG TPA: prolipoprotein diacylglyceryl transferase [Polyangia bacterium]|nr:prolipoprotein diacylglyceryl transferase [Polyangia bacterium]
MRPILVQIPSKLLFAAALVLAVAALARDLWLRRRDPKHELSSTPLYLLAGAEILVGLKSGSWTPSRDGILGHPWTPVPIYAYGVMLGTSLIVGWFIALRLAKEDGIQEQEAGTIYMWTAVWSIIGSRVLYILTNLSEFDGIGDMLMVNRGGLVAYGGMIGGFLASWYGCHKRGIELLRWADVSAPSVVLGTAITRMGCLLFGCDFGARSSLPWAIRFPGPNALAPQGSPAWQHHVRDFGLSQTAPWSYSVHPTQIYEALVGLSLFGLLMWIRKKRTFSGQVFLAWVLGYGIMRPLIEIVRDDDQRGNVGALSTSQFIGIVSVVLGLGLLVALVKKHRRDPAASRLWELPVRMPATASGEPGAAAAAKRRKRR